MTDIIVAQARPEITNAQTVKWRQPINSQTLSSLAHAANALKAGRGFAHVTKQFSYDRDGPGATVLNIYQQSPGANSYDYSIIINEINPLALGVGLHIVYQAVKTDSFSPIADITMTRLSDGLAIDNPVSGAAVQLSTVNGSIPEGGSSEEEYEDPDSGVKSKIYFARSAYCMTDRGAQQNAGATVPRMLYYTNSLAPGDGVKIALSTTDMRILCVSAVEVPRLVIQAG